MKGMDYFMTTVRGVRRWRVIWVGSVMKLLYVRKIDTIVRFYQDAWGLVDRNFLDICGAHQSVGHCFQPLKTQRIKHHGVVQRLQLVWCNRFVSTQNPQLSSRDLPQKADTRRIPNPEPPFSINCSLRKNKASTFSTKSRFYSATFPTAKALCTVSALASLWFTMESLMDSRSRKKGHMSEFATRHSAF